jgi:hypothetical protein
MAVPADDGGVDLEELVREALSDGPQGLAAVTRRVLAHVDEVDHYRSAGRIAAIVAKLTTPRSERERPWTAVTDAVEIEDWAIDAAPGERAR